MVTAFIMVKVGTGELMAWLKTVKEGVSKVQGVKEVYSILGRYDIIAKVEAKSVEELTNIVVDNIRSVPGVSSTETFLVAGPV
jgi:DNA-binding Lrp family transcriptional regulator